MQARVPTSALFLVVCFQYTLISALLPFSPSIKECDVGTNCTVMNNLRTGAHHAHEDQAYTYQDNSHSRRNLNAQSLKERANSTYTKVLPCLQKAWMMKDWGVGDNWAFPDDAEEHFRDINKKAAIFRKAAMHYYSGYAGNVTLYYRRY